MRPHYANGTAADSDAPHNLIDVLRTLFRYKREIIGATLGAMVLAAIVALLLPVYYTSITTFHAAHTDLASPDRIFGSSTDAVDFYGEKEDIDRLVQIARSGEVVAYLVDKFDLYERYDLNPDDPEASFYVVEKLFGHYDIVKNKYDALEMSVEDREPATAARMVNAARNKTAEVAQRLLKEGQALVLKTMEDNIRGKTEEINTLGDSLRVLRNQYQIYNVGSQSEQLSSLIARREASLIADRARLESLKQNRGKRDSINYLTALVYSHEQTIQGLNERLATFNEGMNIVGVMADIQRESTEDLSKDQERYKQYRAAFNTDFQTILLLEEGPVPVLKSRPHRSLIVLATGFIVFVFCVLAVLLYESYRHVDWRGVVRGESVPKSAARPQPTAGQPPLPEAKPAATDA